jgi:hypothetical protein
MLDIHEDLRQTIRYTSGTKINSRVSTTNNKAIKDNMSIKNYSMIITLVSLFLICSELIFDYFLIQNLNTHIVFILVLLLIVNKLVNIIIRYLNQFSLRRLKITKYLEKLEIFCDSVIKKPFVVIRKYLPVSDKDYQMILTAFFLFVLYILFLCFITARFYHIILITAMKY